MNWVGVSVHKFNSTSSTDAQPSLWQATLGSAGDSYKDSTSGLVARVITMSSAVAQVRDGLAAFSMTFHGLE